MAQSITITEMTIESGIIDKGRDFPKTLPPHGRYRYAVNVEYVGDGMTFRSLITGLSKPQLMQNIERTKRHVANRAMSYEHSDILNRWCQVIRFSLMMR